MLPTEATGILMMQATANEGVAIEDVERAIDAEIARIASDGITADELTRAKNRAEVEYAHQIENYDARADLIGMMSTYFDDPSAGPHLARSVPRRDERRSAARGAAVPRRRTIA